MNHEKTNGINRIREKLAIRSFFVFKATTATAVRAIVRLMASGKWNSHSGFGRQLPMTAFATKGAYGPERSADPRVKTCPTVIREDVSKMKASNR